jgi:hypothetical protein
MTSDATSDTTPSDNFGHSFIRGLKSNWFIYLTFVVLVMALAGLIVSITNNAQLKAQNAQLKRVVDCQSRYNEINNERTRQLAEATDRERVAEAASDRALYALAQSLAGGDPGQVIAGHVRVLSEKLGEQDKARKFGDKERLEHPVPPPPKALCGG